MIIMIISKRKKNHNKFDGENSTMHCKRWRRFQTNHLTYISISDCKVNLIFRIHRYYSIKINVKQSTVISRLFPTITALFQSQT